MTTGTLQERSTRKAGCGLFGLGIIIGLVLAVVGLLWDAIPLLPAIPTMSKIIIALAGVGVFLASVAIVAYLNLYTPVPSGTALVRSGRGGQKPFVGGGAFVVPGIHESMWVSLNTFRLDVTRQGETAVLTKDNIRADLKAEFYIIIQPEPNHVLAAVTSLGAKCTDPDEVLKLIEGKLDSVLRDVATSMTLEELKGDREAFAKKVKDAVQPNLEKNGLTLESVTCSNLDQTDPKFMKDDNVFDAQGKRVITQITNEALRARQQIELETKRTLKEREVETDQKVFALEVTQQKAAAETNVEKAQASATATMETAKLSAEADAQAKIAQAEADAKARTAAAEQAKLAGAAEAARDQSVQVAQTEAKKAVEVANMKREQAAAEAAVAKARAIEVANREQQIAVAEAEQRRADAEAKRLAAEKLKTEADQAVLTAQQIAVAERDAKKAVIAKQADADQTRIEQETAANIGAYTASKQAEGELQAAEKRGQARITLAEADKRAAELAAEGEKAKSMVPVNVDREKVNVENARVDVLTRELEAREKFKGAAIELQVRLAEIAATKEARIESARALGVALKDAEFQFWGSDGTLNKLQDMFVGGMAFGQFASGAVRTAPEGVTKTALAAVDNLSGGVGGAVQALAERVFGRPVSQPELAAFMADERVQAVINEFKAKSGATPTDGPST